MDEDKRPEILLTNDDGILSPGLWAAAAALEALGFVHVVAPREQSTGMGRSLPGNSDGIIELQKVTVNGKSWEVYSVGGSPAQAVIHGVLEVVRRKPHLVVSGINYGENFGTGVTISGTVGAALEAAGLNIPALAVSLEVDKAQHRSYSESVDFAAAAHFTRLFAEVMLTRRMPPDVDVLKLEVPADATTETGWAVSHLSRLRYYESLPPRRESFSQPASLDYRQAAELEDFDPQSDVYITRVEKKVAVTPLSLDLTSRVPLEQIDALIRGS
jgi:5'-nucleotidase